MKDFKWTSTKYTHSLSIATKVMIKQSWHNVILGNKMAPIIRGWFRSTFWGLLTFVVSQYARHAISILLWCCHHPPNKPASFLHFLSCTFDIRICLHHHLSHYSLDSCATYVSHFLHRSHISCCVPLYHLWSYPLESRHASSQNHTPRGHITS